jgi:RHS repeat-associated protein
VDYVHDPLGRRIAKKVNGSVTEKYLWQGLTRLLAVFDGTDNLIMRFEYADARMPVAMTKDGSTYYLTYDQVGSLRIVADTSANVLKRIKYDSFGNIIEDTNPEFQIPFGFVGGLHDRDTGLVRFGYRDYDPDTGRWTAKDPIGFAGGDTDLYGYCLNDPVNFVDSEGLWVAQAIGAVLGGGLNAYNNYGAYSSEQMSGVDYAKSIAFGASGGVLSSFGGPFLGAAVSALNNLNEQMLHSDPCNGINWSDTGRAFATGIAVGNIAKGAYKAGDLIVAVPNQIGTIIGSQSAQVTSYGSAFGITANIAGSILTK